MNTAAIATHLNVAESAIVRVEEWANVLLAVVRGLGARFVSKKVNTMKTVTGIVKKFPAVPAKVYSGVEIEEFETAIKLGAGRTITWQSNQGAVTAKIAYAYNGMKDRLHYVLPGGVKIDVPEMLEKIKASGVEFEINTPLTANDYQYI